MVEKPEQLNNHAIHLISDGNFKDAIACLKRALVIDGENAFLWYNLGVAYRDLGELGKAKNALLKAYELNPYDADTIESLGTIYISLKQIDEAADLAYESLGFDEENPRFWNLWGVSYFQKEEYEKASELFEQAVFLNPYYMDALLNLKDTYSELGNRFGVEEVQKKIKQIKK
ncbi:MAG: tetratricopeptide repeat protein [Treponema sp.]|nr:tetratricopeptide repeat protein [Treponema sp.]